MRKNTVKTLIFSNNMRRAMFCKRSKRRERDVEQQQRTSLILAESAVRGALLCPVSDDDNEKAYYVVDTVDGDMFLRLDF